LAKKYGKSGDILGIFMGTGVWGAVARECASAHFDEIVLAILPLLKNGTTPPHQTILSVLEDVAERVGEDSWRLKKDQGTLFD